MEDEQVLPGEVPVLSAPRGKNWCGGDSLTREVWVILGAQGGGWGRTGSFWADAWDGAGQEPQGERLRLVNTWK